MAGSGGVSDLRVSRAVRAAMQSCVRACVRVCRVMSAPVAAQFNE